MCGSGSTAPLIINSALYEGELLASTPDRFSLLGRSPYGHWLTGWVGPKTSPDACNGEQSLASAGNRTLVIEPMALHTC
jgi:hypothetical protein